MLRARTALAALLLFSPFALAAHADLAVPDAAGDESVRVAAAPADALCEDAASDILAYRLRVVGGDLVASMDLRNADAVLACDGAPVAPVRGGAWSILLAPAAPGPSPHEGAVTFRVRPLDATHAEACTSVDVPAAGNVTCARVHRSALFAGDAWSLALPLVEQGGAAWDLRGASFTAQAGAWLDYGSSSASVATGTDHADAAPYAT